MSSPIIGLGCGLGYQLMTQPNIKTPEQLKGVSVAIACFGGAADFVARFALTKLSLDPLKDVTIVQVGTTPDRLTALEARRVQATVLVPPTTFMAQKKGFHLLADIGALDLAYRHQEAVTTKKLLREHPDVVKNFVRAYIESVHRIRGRPFPSLQSSKFLRDDQNDRHWGSNQTGRGCGIKHVSGSWDPAGSNLAYDIKQAEGMRQALRDFK